MTGLCFVDANILIYEQDIAYPDKQAIATEWLRRLWISGSGRISAQVLNEFFVVCTRRLEPGLTVSEARLFVRSLLSWKPIPVDHALIVAAWPIQDRFGLSWWDCLIVAAAQQAGCAYLLTEDLQHGQKIDDLTVISPFEVEPDAILTA